MCDLKRAVRKLAIRELDVRQQFFVADSLPGVEGEAFVIMRDSETLLYEGERSFDALVEWFNAHRFPSLPELVEGNFDSLVRSGKSCLVIVDPEEADEAKRYEASLTLD